jgi:hypothetical protein
MNAAGFTIDQPRRFLPAIRGVIDRRLLVNFRADLDVLARLLPAPFRPKLSRGYGMAGICLIRLCAIRPRPWPAWIGLGSENAAHRFAVEWDEDGVHREGVFIPRRDTGSWLNRFAGGKIFPGVHHAADFEIEESDRRFKIGMRSRDGVANLRVVASLADTLPAASVFGSITEASAFFETGALGWSVGARANTFDGLELRSIGWKVEPLAVESVTSNFFSSPELFPPGSLAFDSALLMRGIPHEWLGRGKMIT